MLKYFNIDELLNSFESDEKNKGKRYREFLYHCFMKFENQIKKIKSKKIINRYETMRKNTLSYLIQHEKEITLKLSR
jgi:6-phosphogluconolactonase/glucosamine-6-phosphate isomerase/deaminase